MGKMQNAVMFTVILELAMILFWNNWSGTSLFAMIFDPSQWTTSIFYTMLTQDLFLAVLAVGIIVGLYKVPYDFIFYLTIGGVLITYIAVISDFFNWIDSQQWFGSAHGLIAVLSTFFLIIYYIFTTLDFVKGKD